MASSRRQWVLPPPLLPQVWRLQCARCSLEGLGGSIHPHPPTMGSQSSQLSHARDGSGGLPIARGGAGGCAHRPSYGRAEACRVEGGCNPPSPKIKTEPSMFRGGIKSDRLAPRRGLACLYTNWLPKLNHMPTSAGEVPSPLACTARRRACKEGPISLPATRRGAPTSYVRLRRNSQCNHGDQVILASA